jgi:hypothetical protein
MGNMRIDLGHWSYSGPEVNVDNMIGFIYCITCGLTNKKYIGKKLLRNKKKRKPLKGKVNSRRYMIDSDWKTYTGSSPSLNEYIIKNGKDGFVFEILSFQPSKLLLAYHETKEIIERNAIFDETYYNEVCCLRIRNRKKQ